MADVINRELEAGYNARLQSLLVSIDLYVEELESEGADPDEVLDALFEYVELRDELGE